MTEDQTTNYFITLIHLHQIVVIPIKTLFIFRIYFITRNIVLTIYMHQFIKTFPQIQRNEITNDTYKMKRLKSFFDTTQKENQILNDTQNLPCHLCNTRKISDQKVFQALLMNSAGL